jgi:triacylglycerol esterase/lipase EstA (alpha/beta hydrolase family)
MLMRSGFNLNTLAQHCQFKYLTALSLFTASGISLNSVNHNNNDSINPSAAVLPNESPKKYHSPSKDLSNLPALKYPVVFVHGLFGYDTLMSRDYFNAIGPLLKKHNMVVLAPALPRSESIEKRAKALQTALGINVNTQEKEMGNNEKEMQSEEFSIIVDANKPFDIKSYKGKFHLIGHSLGGIDCRYLASKLQSEEENRVLTITTIASPHRGSPIANLFFNSASESISQYYYNALSGLYQFLYDRGIDLTAVKNCTPQYMKSFNEEVKMMNGTLYFSYGGAREFKPYSIYYIPSKIIEAIEGANDGLVSVSSSQYGDYRGTVELDHTQQIGFFTAVNHLPLYAEIIRNLAEVEQQHFSTTQAKSIKQKFTEKGRALRELLNEAN